MTDNALSLIQMCPGTHYMGNTGFELVIAELIMDKGPWPDILPALVFCTGPVFVAV